MNIPQKFQTGDEQDPTIIETMQDEDMTRIINKLKLDDSPQKVIIQAIVGNVRTELQIDTGAEISILAQNTFASLPLKYKSLLQQPMRDINIFLADSTTRVNILGVIALPIITEFGMVQEKFVVTNHITVNLLGLPWLATTGILVDVQNSRLLSGNKEILTLGVSTVAIQKVTEEFCWKDLDESIDKTLNQQ